MFKSKKFWYIGLFGILYLIVAFSSFFHACSFFGLANNSWMSIILALAFEIGQAAVLFSLLTSTKDRSRIMPWVLMTMFTLVQVIGNVYSSYKYIINNSSEDLRYFKEPIFIWTDLPDDQATVIIVYLVGALLPLASLLLTSMITNYLTDESEKKIDESEKKTDESEKKIDESENKETTKQEALENFANNFEIKDIDPEIAEVLNKNDIINNIIMDSADEDDKEEIKEDNIEEKEDYEPIQPSHFINFK